MQNELCGNKLGTYYLKEMRNLLTVELLPNIKARAILTKRNLNFQIAYFTQ